MCVCVCVCVCVEDSPTPIKETQVTPGRVYKRNERGETQLHVACIRGDINLATSLIEQGADINATDHAGTYYLTSCTYNVTLYSTFMYIEKCCGMFC